MTDPPLLIAYIRDLITRAAAECRRWLYRGRHRAHGLSTMVVVAEAAAPMYPPVPDRYDHHIGAGRYAHLRQAELDETNDRLIRLRERKFGPAPVVDLQALRVRGAVPTVAEIDDEWLAELATAEPATAGLAS